MEIRTKYGGNRGKVEGEIRKNRDCLPRVPPQGREHGSRNIYKNTHGKKTKCLMFKRKPEKISNLNFQLQILGARLSNKIRALVYSRNGQKGVPGELVNMLVL